MSWKRPNEGAKWTREHDAVLLEKAEGIQPIWMPIRGRTSQQFLAMPGKAKPNEWKRAYSYNLHVEDAIRAAQSWLDGNTTDEEGLSVYIGKDNLPTAHMQLEDEEWDIEAATVAEAVAWAVWFGCQGKAYRASFYSADLVRISR